MGVTTVSDFVEEHELVVAVRDIDKAICAVRDSLPFVADPGVLGDVVCELADVTARLDGLRLELLAQADANGVPQTAGVRTIGQFVAATTSHAPVDTNIAMSAARWLRSFPTFRDAAHAGVLTAAHVRALRKLDNSRTSFKLSQAQDFFVEAAIEQTSFENFLKVCEVWFVYVDPDGEEPKDQIENNAVKFIRKASGRGTMTADMDALTFAAVKKMVMHEAAKIRNDHESVEDLNFANPICTTEAGRRLAGLVDVLTRGYTREDGSFPAPLLNIVMSEKVAEWAHAQMHNPTGDFVPADAFDIDGRCELIDGTVIHPLLVAAMCGFHRFDLPTFRRYIMNAKNRIVDYSYNARIHPEHLRTASLIEHRGRCATLGCDMPEEWLHMDHNDPHSRGGETRLSNTQPLCAPDNYAKTDTPGHTRHIDRPPPNRKPRRHPPGWSDDGAAQEDPDSSPGAGSDP